MAGMQLTQHLTESLGALWCWYPLPSLHESLCLEKGRGRADIQRGAWSTLSLSSMGAYQEKLLQL